MQDLFKDMKDDTPVDESSHAEAELLDCTGRDVEIVDPFAKGEATEKPVILAAEVPGAAKPAQTLYDVSQALSWLATNRNNTEERVDWQAVIPNMIASLRTISRAA